MRMAVLDASRRPGEISCRPNSIPASFGGSILLKASPQRELELSPASDKMEFQPCR